ncbi:MAG: YIP1 family protein [Candidatus Dormiibacterota bacterium]
MPLPVGLLFHPRRFLDAVAARPLMIPTVLVVAVAGAVSLGFDLLAAWLAPAAFAAPSPSLFLIIPVLLLCFWGLCGWLIDAGAGMMARPSRRREILAAVGHCFALLAAYGLVAALQALALRLGAGSGASSALGWLDAPLLLWFVALLMVAVVSVYELEAPSALALALLPFAALMAALLLFEVGAATLAAFRVG